MYTWTGVPVAKIEKMWEDPSTRNPASLRSQPAHEMLSEYHRQQLIPGSEQSVILSDQIVRKIELSLQFDFPDQGSGSIEISLWDLCTRLFIEGTADAYLGHLIWEIHPSLLKSSLKWESSSWKYIYQLPRFLSEDMYSARSELVDAFVQYFKAPERDREDCAFFVSAFEQELRDCNFNDEEVARIFMLHYWA